MKIKIFFSIFVLLILTNLSFAASFNPRLNWKTINTKHFSIHYPERVESVAFDVARISEDAHAKMSPKLSWKPWGKTQIILTDTKDESNGLATVIPYNIMILRVAPPQPDSPLSDYDNYLKMLISHEYTHILHMDAVRGLWKPLKYIFGKTATPVGIMSPLWVKEGFAVYEETIETEAGRGRGSYADMLLRSAILEDNFPKIDKASVSSWRWPTYEAAYIFGSQFILYLVKTYGEDKFLEFNKKTQKSLLIGMINRHAKKVYGKNFYKLWKEWIGVLKNKYQTEKALLEQAGLSKINPEIIQKWDEQFFNPVLSPDSKKLAYVVNTPHSSSEMIIKDLETGKEKRLKGKKATGISWSKDSKKIVYSMLTKHKYYNFFYDLFLYDLEKKTTKVLTSGKRARDPDLSPSDKEVVFVSTDAGTDYLKILNIETKEVTILAGGEPKYIRFDSPRYSPDGKMIAVTVWEPLEGWKIYLYSIDGKIKKRLTSNTGKETSPWWNSNGDNIYFSSDKTGISNIYKANIKTNKVTQITNVLTGLFKPTTKDGKNFYVQEYSSKGYLISSFQLNEKNVLLSKELLDYPIKSGNDKKIRTDDIIKSQAILDFKTKKYSSFGKELFLPRFVLPFAGYLEDAAYFSILTGAEDPLKRHRWLAGASYRTDAKYIGYFGKYYYNRFRPVFGVSINDYAVDFGRLQFPSTAIVDYFEERRTLSGSVLFPFFTKKPAGSHSLGLAYFYEDRMPISNLIASDAGALNLGVFSGFQVSYMFGDYKKYNASISRESGRFVRLSVSATDKKLGSREGNEQQIFSGDWREYIRTWRHQVLGLRVAGGIAWGDRQAQGTFGVGGDIGEGNFAQGGSFNYFPLRGMPVSTYTGTRAMLMSSEYRIPLMSPQRGLGTWPVFLNNIHCAFFADYGDAWRADVKSDELSDFFDSFILGVGAELRGDFILGHALPLTGRLGYSVIVLNRDRVRGLSDPTMGSDLKYGMLILQFGTSF